MTATIIPLAFFGAGLTLLLFSGDMLTRASLRLAVFLNITPLVAGLTITAFATSSPEAAVAIEAAIFGATDIALGNVVGSNIANILLVLGLPAMFMAVSTNIRQIRLHFSLMVGASLLLFAFALKGSIGFLGGTSFLLLVVVWVFYSFKQNIGVTSRERKEVSSMTRLSTSLTFLLFLASAVGLWLGARLTLEGSEQLAALFGISEAVIGLSLIAVGTSLPELATSIAALWRKHADVAIGNILGSNLLNILFVLGISATITTIPIDKVFLQLDILVMLGAVLLLLPFAWWRKPVTKLAGGIFVALYVLYIISLIEIRPASIG